MFSSTRVGINARPQLLRHTAVAGPSRVRLVLASRNVSTVPVGGSKDGSPKTPEGSSFEDKIAILELINRRGLPRDFDHSKIPFDLLGEFVKCSFNAKENALMPKYSRPLHSSAACGCKALERGWTESHMGLGAG